MNRIVLLRISVSLLAGIIFGFGLSLSGMIDPARVLDFLDLTSSNWDPSLIFVLGSALAVAIPGIALQRTLRQPVLDNRFHLPERKEVDLRLVIGSTVFGAGWGLAGLCPGPAIAVLSIGLAPVYLFAAAMAAGMLIHDRFVASVTI